MVMVTNQKEIDRWIKNYTEKRIPEIVIVVVKRRAIFIYTAAVEANPVLTGHSRNSWTYTVNQPPIQIRTEGPGSLTEADLSDLKKLGDYVVISNHAAYIRRLERGWSKQAKAGWIADIVETAQRGG